MVNFGTRCKSYVRSARRVVAHCRLIFRAFSPFRTLNTRVSIELLDSVAFSRQLACSHQSVFSHQLAFFSSTGLGIDECAISKRGTSLLAASFSTFAKPVNRKNLYSTPGTNSRHLQSNKSHYTLIGSLLQCRKAAPPRASICKSSGARR